ncbi:MAG: heme exporter protein CcmD [Kordiimonas sp.]|nr:heme exporter protein CcmD [Kordiimonas sp.]|tara:strand:+ start:404 stop:604 length:201 start_codon:yes stop_codon:yes gene_type:complete
METFFAMGGYGVYIWPAYAVSLGLLLVLAWQSWRRMRQGQRLLEKLEAQNPRRRRGGHVTTSGDVG